MDITIWGSRGSIAACGPEVARYGGNTSCVEVTHHNERLIIDAGTGIRKLGRALHHKCQRVDILISHFHMDHIIGLGFFLPLLDKNVEAHIYGPADSEEQLEKALTTYLHPPLFPISLRELPCKLFLHALQDETIEIGVFTVTANRIKHPGETIGYRVVTDVGSMAYMSDHELGINQGKACASTLDHVSGYVIANNVDLLLHDCQYSTADYPKHVNWGHSTFEQTLAFAQLCKVKSLVTFHHDPSYSDEKIDQLIAEAVANLKPDFKVLPGHEGDHFKIPSV